MGKNTIRISADILIVSADILIVSASAIRIFLTTIICLFLPSISVLSYLPQFGISSSSFSSKKVSIKA